VERVRKEIIVAPWIYKRIGDGRTDERKREYTGQKLEKMVATGLDVG
jgi:hypothetical protein